MGELGISLGDPDDWALDVLGDILNSFGGRLFDRIRSREVHLAFTSCLLLLGWDSLQHGCKIPYAMRSLEVSSLRWAWLTRIRRDAFSIGSSYC